MADERPPENAGEAAHMAMEWATGRRSWTNAYHDTHTPDVVATMDAQEVVKWSAIAVMFAQMDAAAVSVQQANELMDHQRAAR